MASGRHVRRSSRALLIAGVAAGVLVLLLGGISVAAYRYEDARSGELLPGVKVAGLDVGGMTRGEAIAAVQDVAAQQLQGQIAVTAAGHRWTVSRGALGQRAKVEKAVDQAMAVSNEMGTLSRVWHRLRDEPISRSVDLSFVGHSGVGSFVSSIADDVAVTARNARITLHDGQVVFRKARAGVALDVVAARASVRSALAANLDHVQLATDSVAPNVVGRDLGPTVVVRVDRNRLYLYDGFKQVGEWPVATAKPGYTTPDGVWTVWDKRVDPTWYNPALDSWGANLPAVVPGGPGNPMGARAIYIDAPGLIRIHGTSEPSSIGRYASHGCIRMQNADVSDLFESIKVGMHVIIAGERPAGAQNWDTPGNGDI